MILLDWKRLYLFLMTASLLLLPQSARASDSSWRIVPGRQIGQIITVRMARTRRPHSIKPAAETRG